jgi:hypothetical protein
MMEESVAYGRLMNTAWLGIRDAECFIRTVCVCFVFQVTVECKNVIHQTILKSLHISLLPLSTHKLTPCTEEILCGDDTIVGMSELNHTPKNTPPRPFQEAKLIAVVLKLKDTYGVWQRCLTNFPKANRFTLGSKIDGVFLSAIEYSFLASYATGGDKLALLDRAISRTDLLKLLLQLAWEVRALDNNKYASLGTQLSEVGRMLGGWRRQLMHKTPAREEQEKQ